MKIMIFGYVFPSYKYVRELLGMKPYGKRHAGKRASIRGALSEDSIMEHLGATSRVEARQKMLDLMKEKGNHVVIRME